MKQGKILNPATKRYVKIDGKIGRAVLAKQKVDLLNDIKSKCNNDSDPISMDNFDEMTLEQLQNLVFIGEGDKKNCYILENIFEVYKNAVLNNKPIKDPMDPSYILNDKEIQEINNKMKQKNENYVPPKFESYPASYRLDIILSTRYINYFSIKVFKSNRVILDLGIVPAWVETEHTGSVDYTSGVLVSNLQELWERKLFLTEDMKNCVIPHFKYNYAYWQMDWREKFIALCDKIKEI